MCLCELIPEKLPFLFMFIVIIVLILSTIFSHLILRYAKQQIQSMI